MSYDTIDALRLLGYSDREAAFLYAVAVHSGYFLRRQFCEFVRRERGSISTYFLRKAIGHGLIRAMDVDGRHFIYHLCGKSLYRMLDDPDSQNRRVKSGGEILRRLMLLDYVLRHVAADEFLETDDTKRRYFLQAKAGEDAIRRASSFGEPVPVSIARDGESRIIRFVFIDQGYRSLSKFERFLTAYKALVCALPHSEVVYAARGSKHFQDATRLFERRFSSRGRTTPACPMGIEHLIRWLTVNHKFHVERHSITPEEHRLLQEGECIYRDPVHIGVVTSWNNGAMDAGKVRKLFHANGTEVGFRTELIEASYPRLLSFGAGHSAGHETGKRDVQIALFNNEIAERAGQG
ncbi:MAG: hypothetical protein ABR905_07515 [Terracidiphilus sp.]|jgi:hypothetical protein